MKRLHQNQVKIKKWLKAYDIKAYTLIEDEMYGFMVDVHQDIELSEKQLDFIPVKFNIVHGFLDCSNNQLTSLEFAPVEVQDFNCKGNLLTSLQGSPQKINGNFNCRFNKLEDLKGAPRFIGDNFHCDCNGLKSLEGCPDEIGGTFYCNLNDLSDFMFCPKRVDGIFRCSDNPRLEQFQEISDFQEIYKEHLKINQIIYFNDHLNKNLKWNGSQDQKTKI